MSALQRYNVMWYEWYDTRRWRMEDGYFLLSFYLLCVLGLFRIVNLCLVHNKCVKLYLKRNPQNALSISCFSLRSFSLSQVQCSLTVFPFFFKCISYILMQYASTPTKLLCCTTSTWNNSGLSSIKFTFCYFSLLSNEWWKWYW